MIVFTHVTVGEIKSVGACGFDDDGPFGKASTKPWLVLRLSSSPLPYASMPMERHSQMKVLLAQHLSLSFSCCKLVIIPTISVESKNLLVTTFRLRSIIYLICVWCVPFSFFLLLAMPKSNHLEGGEKEVKHPLNSRWKRQQLKTGHSKRVVKVMTIPGKNPRQLIV